MSNSTEAKVRSVIESSMEDTAKPDAILAYLKAREGKPITKRDVDKLRELLSDPTIYLSTRYGMTHLEWGGYYTSGGNKGGCLTIASEDKNVRIDSARIEERNIAYFAAAKDRNAKRVSMLADDDGVRTLAEAIDAHNDAVKTIKGLTAWDEPFYVARFYIEPMLDKA